MSSPRVIPGYRLSVSYTLLVMTALILIPLGAVILKSTSLTWDQFVSAVWTRRTRSAYLVTFGASFVAAIIDTLLGLLVAWVLVRYEFFGKRFFDSLIDLPFALPTAVAGLVYSSLFVENGWYGQYLVPLGIHGAYSRLGIVLVLTFIGLPFVVRSVQPVLESLDADVEEAASSLGASRWQVFWKILLPALRPALMTGFALTFARGIGEYGSIVFISNNKMFETEIAPMIIVSKLDEFREADAAAVAVVLLIASFVMLGVINGLERWSRRHEA